jgi:murein DD-endopeptidase MepM/ murein hydrolase activator NlpD
MAQGGFIVGQAPPGSQISLNGEPIRQSASGAFAFGFNRDASEQAVFVVEFNGQTLVSKTLLIRQRDYQIQRISGVPQRTVTPDPEHSKRIRDEAALMRQARTLDLDLSGFTEAFVWPATGPITGVYGSQRFYNGEPRSPHYGVDIAGPEGSTVIAPASGRVTLVHPDMFFSGGTLVIDHGHGISSTFIHLHKILVKLDDPITQGQAIAEIGSTGRATGPHLDWRMNWHHHRLDPQLFMPPMSALPMQ